MKIELSIKKIKCTREILNQDVLIPASEKSIDVLKTMPYSKKCFTKINYNSKHSIERHDLFFACVKLVTDNLGKTQREVIEQCKLDCRWFEGYVYYKDKNGNERVNVMTKSISFSMTIQEANEFYSKAFDVLATYLDITTEELVNEAKLRMQHRHYCILCGRPATQKHHKFSQAKWAIEKYGKKLIDADFNIEWICIDDHVGHRNIPKELIWNERRFIQEAINNGYLNNKGEKT